MLKEFERPEDGLGKEERRVAVRSLQRHLTAQQHRIREAGLPVLVLVEGWSAAGKGSLINSLVSELDPRFATVFSADQIQDADRYPFLYPYFKAIPENGKFLFMDGGWMEKAVRDSVSGRTTEAEYLSQIQNAKVFERQLCDNGYLVIKLFLQISEKEQTKRLTALEADPDTAWRVKKADLAQNRSYKACRKVYEDFMARTDAPTEWSILDGSGRTKCLLDALQLITAAVDARLEQGKYSGAPGEQSFSMAETPKLQDVDLTLSLDEETYQKQLKKYQKRLAELHNQIYRRRIPVIVAFEGWDAAGKGGAICRLAKPLDPRGCQIWPIASPIPAEKQRHFLWRFWTRLPRSGHIAIFDRTWYGRVMVERIEGYCTEKDWNRAYGEINEFEQQLTEWGAVVLKFWLQVDQDTQLVRFNERQNTPEKQWKITDEDWRNREKWPQYEEAIGEMLEKTSTVNVPWHVIEADDEKYARIKVLKTVTEALEAALQTKN